MVFSALYAGIITEILIICNALEITHIIVYVCRLLQELILQKHQYGKRMMKHETINVGNLGTSPVWKYSSNTGMKKDNPNNAKNKLKIEKKQNGL